MTEMRSNLNAHDDRRLSGPDMVLYADGSLASRVAFGVLRDGDMRFKVVHQTEDVPAVGFGGLRFSGVDEVRVLTGILKTAREKWQESTRSNPALMERANFATWIKSEIVRQQAESVVNGVTGEQNV